MTKRAVVWKSVQIERATRPWGLDVQQPLALKRASDYFGGRVAMILRKTFSAGKVQQFHPSPNNKRDDQVEIGTNAQVRARRRRFSLLFFNTTLVEQCCVNVAATCARRSRFANATTQFFRAAAQYTTASSTAASNDLSKQGCEFSNAPIRYRHFPERARCDHKMKNMQRCGPCMPKAFPHAK